MVILISGATHVGKTKLAQALLESCHYPYLSIDHLKMGLIRSGICPLTVEDDEELTAFMWPILREMIKTAIENEQNLIIEGCYIPFNWEESFTEGYRDFIHYICICMSEGYIDKNYAEITSHASDIESRLDDAYAGKTHLNAENQFFLEGCRQHGCAYWLIEKDYEKSIAALLNNLIATVCEKTPSLERGNLP